MKVRWIWLAGVQVASNCDGCRLLESMPHVRLRWLHTSVTTDNTIAYHPLPFRHDGMQHGNPCIP